MRADVGFLPILIFWGAMVLIARTQNARKQAALREQQRLERGNIPDAPAEPAAPAGLMEELGRAMTELKRAEQQQRARVERKPRASMFTPAVNRPVAAAVESASSPAKPVVRAVAPPAPVVEPPTRNPLARFATGSPRDALILNEILGRPVAERLDG